MSLRCHPWSENVCPEHKQSIPSLMAKRGRDAAIAPPAAVSMSREHSFIKVPTSRHTSAASLHATRVQHGKWTECIEERQASLLRRRRSSHCHSDVPSDGPPTEGIAISFENKVKKVCHRGSLPGTPNVHTGRYL